MKTFIRLCPPLFFQPLNIPEKTMIIFVGIQKYQNEKSVSFVTN